MSRPSQARARRGIKAEAEQLARRGRPTKAPGPAPAPPSANVKPAAAPAVPQPPSEQQGRQFGLTVRACLAPLYVAVCGAELPAPVWEEWGVAAGLFAAHYFPNAATHPGYQFAGATAILVLPVALAWPQYAANRAALRKADAAKRQNGGSPEPPAAGKPAAPMPPKPPASPAATSIGTGWEKLKGAPPTP